MSSLDITKTLAYMNQGINSYRIAVNKIYFFSNINLKSHWVIQRQNNDSNKSKFLTKII